MKTLLIAISTVILGSCAMHSGQLVSDVPNKPVKHIDIAVGVATTSKVFGMGGVGKDALLFEARQQMISNRPLVDNEAYNNYTVDYKRTYFIIGSKTKVTVTADVISPKDTISSPSYSAEYLRKMGNQYSYYDSLFWIGDSVIFNTNTYGKIVGFEGRDNKKVRIQYTDNGGDFKTKVQNAKGVYVLVDYYRGNRPRVTRTIGRLVAYGLNGDIFISGDGSHFYYDHMEDE